MKLSQTLALYTGLALVILTAPAVNAGSKVKIYGGDYHHQQHYYHKYRNYGDSPYNPRHNYLRSDRKRYKNYRNNNYRHNNYNRRYNDHHYYNNRYRDSRCGGGRRYDGGYYQSNDHYVRPDYHDRRDRRHKRDRGRVFIYIK